MFPFQFQNVDQQDFSNVYDNILLVFIFSAHQENSHRKGIVHKRSNGCDRSEKFASLDSLVFRFFHSIIFVESTLVLSHSGQFHFFLIKIIMLS